MDRALQGPNKEALAAQILRQFPVALIDEFQDTDPIQYRIFNAVYEVAKPRRDATMLLIGDPKQAIYAFRGADIFTYLKAREDTPGRHVTLGTNYRSSRAMVSMAWSVGMLAWMIPWRSPERGLSSSARA